MLRRANDSSSSNRPECFDSYMCFSTPKGLGKDSDYKQLVIEGRQAAWAIANPLGNARNSSLASGSKREKSSGLSMNPLFAPDSTAVAHSSTLDQAYDRKHGYCNCTHSIFDRGILRAVPAGNSHGAAHLGAGVGNRVRLGALCARETQLMGAPLAAHQQLSSGLQVIRCKARSPVGQRALIHSGAAEAGMQPSTAAFFPPNR